jgi:hypothetical protein
MPDKYPKLDSTPQYAHDPYRWLKQAKELDRAAMLIWEAIRKDFELMSLAPIGTTLSEAEIPNAGLGDVFWLNAGFALENLLKGLIVQNNPSSVINGIITKNLKTHNLIALAKRVPLDLEIRDAFFLDIGTRCITWAGRYPCSINLISSKPFVFSEADVMVYRSLFNKLSSRIIDNKSENNSRMIRLFRLC